MNKYFVTKYLYIKNKTFIWLYLHPQEKRETTLKSFFYNNQFFSISKLVQETEKNVSFELKKTNKKK